MGGCPFHEDGDAGADEGDEASTQGQRTRTERDLGRRDFVKSALLIGGAGAVGSLGRVAGITPTASAAETEPISAAARLNRQHAWDAYESRVATGNTAQPPNSLFLMLDYRGTGEPTPADRRAVEGALSEIERHFEWHAGGVLFTMAYSAEYFDRFDADLPPGAAPDDQQTVASTVADLTDLADTNDAITPDTYDACLLLASKNAANLLGVEAALWGADDFDLGFEHTFEGVFTKPEAWPDRRVGFAGPEFQEREAKYEEGLVGEEGEIPDEAPLSMGHVAGFGESIPHEDRVTLQRDQRFPSPTVDAGAVPTDRDYVGDVGERDPGVFAQGTLKHLSHLELDLETWYGEDGADATEGGSAQRRHQMYSPYHPEDETNARDGDKPGSGLTDDHEETPSEDGPDIESHTVREYADRTPETATGADADAETTTPTAGHSQKTARARYDIDGDGEPEQPVLRRDWDNVAPVGPDGRDRAGYHFNVPMRFNESIYTLLDATYNIGFESLDGRIDHDPVDPETIADRNGIAPYMTATRRGNWLVPPITVRALPSPRATELPLSVRSTDDAYLVKLAGTARLDEALDRETVRFGTVDAVDKAGGAAPTGVSRRGGTTTFRFPAADTDLDPGDTAKLFGKREGSRKPVVGTEPIRHRPGPRR